MQAASGEGVSTLQSIFPVDQAVRAEAPPAAIYSFVPAGGAAGDRNQSLEAVRQLSEAMGDYLAAEGDVRSVLLAGFSGTSMVSRSWITCLDLSGANPREAREALGISEAVFVVSATDPASIEDARAQAAWMLPALRSHRKENACGLLLVPVSGGVTSDTAEKRTGLPVCGVLRTPQHIAELARRIVED